jgi:hypothetical protein
MPNSWEKGKGEEVEDLLRDKNVGVYVVYNVITNNICYNIEINPRDMQAHTQLPEITTSYVDLIFYIPAALQYYSFLPPVFLNPLSVR